MTDLRKPSHPEHDMQASQFAILAPQYQCKWMFAIPNAMPGNVRQQAWMKREGRRAGVSDIFLPVAALPYHGLFIENKILPNKLSKEQAMFIIDMDAESYAVAVCFSTQQMVDTVHRYLNKSHRNTAAVELARKRLEK